MIAVLSRAAPPDPATARRMLATSPHRGTCFTLKQRGQCLLGASSGADFADSTIGQDGELSAVVSGSLDNAAELMAQLGKIGHPPAGRAAADVVAAAFRAYGPAAVGRFRGAFAGVVTDGRRLWCFRDHLGLRPLFYHHGSRGFFAATEAKQIVAGAGLPWEPDLEVLERIFYGNMLADTPHALKGVRRLPQATILTVAAGGATAEQRYWFPEERLETLRVSAGDVADRFTELFGQAVRRTLTGCDVISLSGGIDSTAIAAYAAPQYRERGAGPLHALSAVFPDFPAVDERGYIELAAGHLGISLHTFQQRARLLDDIAKWCELLDGPVPIVSVPEISENYALARELGFRNLLTGDFAEFVVDTRPHLISHLLTRGRWTALARVIASEARRGASRRAILRGLVVPLLPGWLAASYRWLRGRTRPPRVPEWLACRKFAEARYQSDLRPAGRSRWSALQLAAFEGATITMEADELCAALNGVTVRRPFGDVDLWEFFLGLPAEIKFPDLGSKTLVRGLLRGRLPDAILDRRYKTAFDDHVMSQVDYPTLRRFLLAPNHQMDGVDYRRLATHLEREDLALFDWFWAKELAGIHAFLSLC